MTKDKMPSDTRNEESEYWRGKLFELRNRHLGLTQEDFAKFADYNVKTIHRFEKGEQIITKRVINHIVKYLHPIELTRRIKLNSGNNDLVEIINEKSPHINLIKVIEAIDIENFFNKTQATAQPSSIHGLRTIPIIDHTFEETFLPNWPENFRLEVRKKDLEFFIRNFHWSLANLEWLSFKSLVALSDRFIKSYEQLNVFMPSNGRMLVYSATPVNKFSFSSGEETQAKHNRREGQFIYKPIVISISEKNSELFDIYFNDESNKLKEQLDNYLDDILKSNAKSILCVFTIAPQPLVVQLGRFLSQVSNIEIYQPRRIKDLGVTWDWGVADGGSNYLIQYPENINNTIVLNLSIDKKINEKDIIHTLGSEISIWTLTINNPDVEFFKSKNQLADFVNNFKYVIVEISNKHPNCRLLHVFLSVPIAIAFEIGRIWKPGKNPDLRLYGLDSESGDYIPMHTISANNHTGKIDS